MKEIYKVQTPKRIVFGDPLYFEEFSGARLEQLVVDVQPPEAFGARVVLREFSAAEAPDTLIRTMEVYLDWPGRRGPGRPGGGGYYVLQKEEG